jgi:hypothetical protein
MEICREFNKNMDNKQLFKKVKDLNLPLGKYALFGSAPMGIRNLKDCHDADIIVAEDLWEEYKNKGWEIKNSPFNTIYLCKEEIELWKEWRPEEWNIRELIGGAEIIDGLPFVRLEKVVEWKKIYGREKDLRDIEVIENFLNAR